MHLLWDLELIDLRIATRYGTRPLVVILVVDRGRENRTIPIEENGRPHYPITAIVLNVSKPPPGVFMSTSQCSVWTRSLFETVHWRTTSTSMFAWAGLMLKLQ
jgi:hypothetical protein